MTTPLYGIPYLVEGEPFNTFRLKSEQIAFGLEDALQTAGITPPDLADFLADLATFNTLAAAGVFTDSGWQAVPVAGPFAAHTVPPAVRKIGKTVYARGGWTNAGLTANTVTAVGTIPAGYRPATQLEFVPGMSSPGSTGKAFVATTGVVSLNPGGTVPGYMRFDAQVWMVD